VGSTSQILHYCETSGHSEYIIGTEYGVVERLRHYNSDNSNNTDKTGKKYHLLTPSLVCPNMKKTTMQDIYNCLANESDKDKSEKSENIIELPAELINKANKPLEKMLELG
jgi:quinolinate synthase